MTPPFHQCSMILWDLDGVLFETFAPDGSFLWSRTIEQDLGIPRRVLERLFRSDAWEQALLGLQDEKDIIAAFFTQEKIVCSPDVFLSYWLEKDLHPRRALTSLLKQLPSCLATNQTPRRADRIERMFEDTFQRLFISSRLHIAKPDPAFFETVENVLGQPSATLCLIDDTLAVIKAAQKCGWQTHHFQKERDLITALQASFPGLSSDRPK